MADSFASPPRAILPSNFHSHIIDASHPVRRRPLSANASETTTSPSASNHHDDIFSEICSKPSQRRRSSAFFEVGLGGEDAIVDAKIRRNSRSKLQVRFRNTVDVVEPDAVDWSSDSHIPATTYAIQPEPMPPYFPTLPRLLFLTACALLLLQSLSTSPSLRVSVVPIGAKAGHVGKRADDIVKRADSPTDVCKRWAHQTAVVNGTIYLYGGRASTQAGQTQNTWSNDFLTVDLTKSWRISSPKMTGLPIPSGPPAVALGYLWSSYDHLFLYGGQFSDSPVASPVEFSTWIYDIASSSWSSQSNPVTAAGEHSDAANAPVQRAAEGAGVTVPSLGRGFYFGGHLDGYTTKGWSQSIPRVYLTSMLEYTFPGYSNPSLTENPNTPAPSEGIYRNITQGGIQESAGFPERADGILVYVPGFGEQGILLGLAGGTNQSFTQMNVIDVYDIATSTWSKQSTSGPTPEIRVNPCAVALSAADGSSTQVYMYGGQNLIPYGEQEQYDDMWILTIPSFTWIQVDTTSQSVPPARAGHTCNVWNSQMVVVGGYVGRDLSCDSPGVYIFNTSSLRWQNDYVALSTENKDDTDSLNRQLAQRSDPNALPGSYGYLVPQQVQKVIGGNVLGSATVTAPAQSATQGPLATGAAVTYTVTGTDGALVTSTSIPNPNNPSLGNNDKGGSISRAALIAVSILAALFFLLSLYLLFCLVIYRKQLQLYKHKVVMAQHQQLEAADNRFIGAIGAFGGIWGKSNLKDNEKASSTSGTGVGGTDSRHSTSNRSADVNSNSQPDPNAPPLPTDRRNPLASNNPYRTVPGGSGLATAASSTDDLMAGQEPSFLGVVLNPRRSLRVVNRD